VLSVGVIVATRNAGAQVRTALAAIAAQNPPPDEVVVVDAASTDDTRAVAGEFAGVRVVSQPGEGLGAARNQGVDQLTSEVVTFCDADDRWPPGSLAKRLRRLEEDPSCDAVIGQCVMVPIGEPIPARAQARLGVPQPGYTPGALAVRRSAFDALGRFDEELHIGSDADWFVRLAESDLSLAVLEDLVLAKGVRADSLSSDVAAYRRELLRIARAYVRRERAGRRPEA
jgi:glycosyltransferase involved in cell wall biosynthesis